MHNWKCYTHACDAKDMGTKQFWSQDQHLSYILFFCMQNANGKKHTIYVLSSKTIAEEEGSTHGGRKRRKIKIIP